MTTLAALLLAAAVATPAKDKDKGPAAPKDPLSADTFSGLAFRSIGPAVMSGRIADIAVSPRPATYFVAVASGGVWRTTDWGITFTPLFDAQPSFSTGCVTVDPKDPLTVWVGTGENNSQRSVSYGDGVYRSGDNGKTWENVGLKESEHIGRIVIDPRDSRVVYVAAQGPLWRDGGDRGLYKTTDAGKTWKKALDVSERTGVSDVWLDPRDPDVILASSWQRRRHVWTAIQGGPESAVHRSTDAGATWKKVEGGLPKGELGRIALAISPANPDVVYAMVEASERKTAGTYRSIDGGINWERRGDYSTPGAQYYHELFPDPKNPDRVYAVDVFMKVTEDGGKTWRSVGEQDKHVDNHALWIDPEHTEHLLNGNDGGLYESWDRGKTWQFKPNLPITQFYRVAVDNAKPFYNVYGGTQDNATLGGPSRTRNNVGITNADWFVTVFGDGFGVQVDPEDENLVYTESQYGVLARFDRRTGEKIDIQPQPGPGEEPLRYHWDAPLLLSPHSRTRLYFGTQRLFRSDDRGDNWKAVSPDLTAGIDRNQLKVMGRVWSVDAVARNRSTSFYGNIVALDESPVAESLLYVGTDDGLVQVSEDGGATWRKQDRFPGVPERTYVADVHASPHDKDVVYAALNNHKSGDFKPYLLKSADRGRTWTSIAAGLPDRGSTWTVLEDPSQKDLLFVGTEFGVFFSPSGGSKWIQLKGGLPTIAVRDMVVQKREGDLVLATFGRGFYVLDDLTPLRKATASLLGQEAALFPVRPTAMFVPEEPYGIRGRGFQGASHYTAENPPFGALITYHLKDELTSLKRKRQDEEQKLAEKGADVPQPAWADLDKEASEEEPAVVLTISDESGAVVRRLTGPAKAGFHRVAWDLRHPAPEPTSLEPFSSEEPWRTPPMGPLALPGRYRVTLAKRQGGVTTPLGEPQAIETTVLGAGSLPEPDRQALMAFAQKTARLQRAVLGAKEAIDETTPRLKRLKKALDDAPAADGALGAEVRALEGRLRDLDVKLDGGSAKQRYQEPVPASIVSRVQGIVDAHWTTTQAPTGTMRRGYDQAAADFAPLLADLTRLIETDLPALERKADAAGAAWTPGRVPRWTKE
jgi:photosystem II stability/assembly factor-like uncharacterized protein